MRLLLDSQHCLDNIDNVDNLDNQNANILEEGFCTEIILVGLKYLQTTKIGQAETQDYYFLF